VWYRVKQGIQGLIVLDREGKPVVFMLCEPSTGYYRVMTRAEWMPVLVCEVINNSSREKWPSDVFMQPR
jgi:hypothetical protein